MTHTPGPWTLEEVPYETNDSAGGWYLHCEEAEPLYISKAHMSEEDAQHIVHCVNTHDALCEALEVAKVTITRLGQQRHGFNSYQGTLDVIEQALAAAKGVL